MMRRRDKELTDREQIEAVIRDSQVCRLALALDNVPYLVPLSFGFDGGAIYLHTAPEGRKIAFFEGNPHVCFEFERHVELHRDPQVACKWSFNYESVVGYGALSELIEPSQKEHALDQIMRHYSGRSWSFDPASVSKVRVWKITIRSLTGKQSRPKTAS